MLVTSCYKQLVFACYGLHPHGYCFHKSVTSVTSNSELLIYFINTFIYYYNYFIYLKCLKT